MDADPTSRDGLLTRTRRHLAATLAAGVAVTGSLMGWLAVSTPSDASTEDDDPPEAVNVWASTAYVNWFDWKQERDYQAEVERQRLAKIAELKRQQKLAKERKEKERLRKARQKAEREAAERAAARKAAQEIDSGSGGSSGGDSGGDGESAPS